MMSLAFLLTSLLIAAIVAPAPWARSGLGPSASGRPPASTVARVNGVPITGDRLQLAINALLPLESFHRQVKPEALAALRQKALQHLVDEELQYQDGVQRGFRVSAVEVEAGFVRLRNRYANARAYQEARRRSGVTLAILRREIRRALTISKVYDDTVTSKCQVGRDEAAAFFAANHGRFVVPEQVHLYTITIGVDPSSPARQWAGAKSRAEDVRRRLERGASFEAMARAYSTDPSRDKGGDLGFVHRGSLIDEVEQAARDLQPGEVSRVVQTLYGYHLIRVAEVRPSQQKSFAEVRVQVQQDLTAKRCAAMHDAWVAGLRAGAAVVPGDATPGQDTRSARAQGRAP